MIETVFDFKYIYTYVWEERIFPQSGILKESFLTLVQNELDLN